MSQIQTQNESLEMGIWGIFRKILGIHGPSERHRPRPNQNKNNQRHGAPQVNETTQKLSREGLLLEKFIPALPELFEPFQHLLKKDVMIRWTNEQQATF